MDIAGLFCVVTETRRSPCYKPPYLLEYIRKPMVTLPPLTIREVILIGISLPLKRYCPISLMTVSEDDKPDEPFNNIPQVEKYIKHFLHLLGMYLLMIERYITNRSVSSCEENPEEVHISKTSRGNNFILDNLHTR